MATEGYIELSALVRKEKNQFASWCPEFDVASCGDTVEEACENLYDAVELYLNELEVVGEIEKVFKERYIKFYKEPCSRLFLSSWQARVPIPA